MAQTVYVTRVIPQPGIDLLRRHVEVGFDPADVPLTHDQLCEKAATHDGLVTLLTDRIDREVLDAGRGKLRVVANVAVGYDNIDVQAATDAGVVVTNTPGVLTDTTTDLAWALLMGIARRISESERFLRAGKYQGWGVMMLLGGDVHGKTLGLVGFGRIGQAMARRASGFNMRVLYYDPVTEAEEAARLLGAERVELETLIRESDFISLHTPLTDETHHLFGATQFDMMKNSAYLINTSRGPVIDEAALAVALKDHTIAGAALDVFENEPEVHPELLRLDNVLMTPHIGSASVATRTRMATMAAENALAVLQDTTAPNALNAV
ncbi:MAG: D-glycerate dehydrogenase [Chloroflexota bacterium]